MRGSRPSNVFDPSDPVIKNDLHMMIYQYLREEQLFSTADCILTELNLKISETSVKRSQICSLKNSICRGEWDDAHQVLGKLVPRQDIRRFLYHLNRLEYLELIETSQHQQAVVFLQTHLKPFEDVAASQLPNDFKELCYLLSCKSLAESEFYSPFVHFMKQREVCAEEICQSLYQYLQIQIQAQVLSEDNGLPTHPSSSFSSVPIVGGSDKNTDGACTVAPGEEVEVETQSEIEKQKQKQEQRQKQAISDALECGAPAAGRLVSLLQQAFAFQIMSKAPAVSNPHSSAVTHSVASASTAQRERVALSAISTSTSISACASAALPVTTTGESSTPSSLSLGGTHTKNPPIPASVRERPAIRISRLLEDYKPLSIPSSVSAILTKYPIVPSTSLGTPHNENPENSREGSRRNLGGIKCFSMITACGSDALNNSEFTSDNDFGCQNDKLTVVAGTDRGSLLLWQIPAKQRRSARALEGSSSIDSDVNRDGDEERECVFDIADEAFADRLIAPSAVLQLRKGDNVRVRRTYKDDDDDDAELFPPKIRDVAISPATDSLVWSHSDSSSSSSSSALVAAALSDGTIALVCVRAGRVGDKDDYRGRAKSKSRSQGASYLTNDTAEEREDRRDARRGMALSFSNKRSYLETHEGDVYSVSFHPEGRHIVSGGIDHTVAVHDVVAATCVKQFDGHQAAVTHVAYNRIGNLVVSSSRDGTVKLWDTLSGLCVRTIVPTLIVPSSSSVNSNGNGNGSRGRPSDRTQSSSSSSSSCFSFYSSTSSSALSDCIGGEISSTSMSGDGRYLLVVPKLSAVRLLDLRMGTVLTRYSPSASSSSSTANGIAHNRGFSSNNDNSSSHCSSSGLIGNMRSNSNSNINSNSSSNSNIISNSNSSSHGGSRSRSSSVQRVKAADPPSPSPVMSRVSHSHNSSENFNFNSSKKGIVFLSQQVSFCSDSSAVAMGGGSRGSVVQLWSADKGHLMRSLSLCCGHSEWSRGLRGSGHIGHLSPPLRQSSSPSPLRLISNASSSFNSLDQSQSQSHQRVASLDKQRSIRSSSPGIAFSRENVAAMESSCSNSNSNLRAEEVAEDRRYEQRRPRRSSDEVEREVREGTWLYDREKDCDKGKEGEIEKEREREETERGLERGWEGNENEREVEADSDTVEREREREGDTDDALNLSDVDCGRDEAAFSHSSRDRCVDPELELIADSMVFSTRYDEKYGILAAASAAGITLWT